MNKEEPYRNQAEKTKQKIEKLNEPGLEDSKLPPRSQIHRNRKKKTNWKLKFPLIRLLALFFILLPITIFIVYSYQGSRHSEKVSVPSNKGYETVDVQSSKKAQNKKETKAKDPKAVQDQEGGIDQSQTETQAAEQPAANTTAVQAGTSTDKESAPSSQTNAAAIPKEENKVLYHTVQRKETLTSISRKYYQSDTGVETIKAANHLRSDTIPVGKVLKIPLNN
jgi:LysM repeat protein